MAFIDGTALNVAMPAIQNGLHASGVQLLWMVNAYLLMLAALIPVGGSLGDLFGRKKVFSIGIGLFMLASLICGLSPNADFLVWARAAQGIGSALMIPGSLAIISSFFGPTEKGRAIGTWSAATTIVTVIGPILGGVLSGAGLWRVVFLINIPLGIAALIPLFLKVPESRNEKAQGRIDFPGAGLLIIALAGLTFGFVSAPDHGFGDPRIIAALSLGIVALAGFLFVEARNSHPMIPLSLFSSRTFSGTNLLTLALYGALSVGMFFLSLNLVQAQGYTMALAGFAFTPFALVLTALSRWAGGLVDRSGPRLPLVVGPGNRRARLLLHGMGRRDPGAVTLLGELLSRRAAAGHRDGDHGGPSHNGSHELGGVTPFGDCLGHQQRRLSDCGGPCHCRGRSVVTRPVCPQPGRPGIPGGPINAGPPGARG